MIPVRWSRVGAVAVFLFSTGARGVAAQAGSPEAPDPAAPRSAPQAIHHGVWRPVVIGSLGVILAGIADHQIRIDVHDRGGAQLHAAGITVSRWSPPLAFGIGGGLLGVGMVTHDPELTHVGRDAVTAMAVAGVLTQAVKIVVGRARPYTDLGTHYFLPFRTATRYNSFPSGHTSQAFSLAAVIAAHAQRRAVRFAAFGAASVVGIARIAADRHFASDVVAGAILGTVVGNGVVRHFGHDSARVTIVPVVASPGAGFAVRLVF